MNEYLVVYINEYGSEQSITMFAKEPDECIADLADIYPSASIASISLVKEGRRVN